MIEPTRRVMKLLFPYIIIRSFIVSNVRDSLVYIFGGLKTMLLCIEFSPVSSDHSSVRLSVRMYVINLRYPLSFVSVFSKA